MEIARGGGVGRGRYLRHAQAQHLAARARGARAHADQQRVGADVHQLEARLVGDDVTDDQGNGQVLLQISQVDGWILGGDVAGGGDRGLNHEDVRSGLLRDLREALGALGDRGDDRRSPALLDLADPLMDQLFLDGLDVERLDDLGRFFLAGRNDPLEDFLGIRVAGEDAFEVQHREAAVPSHLDGELWSHHAVHGRGDDRQLETMATKLPGDVDFVRVDGHGSGNERDVIEPVRDPGLAPSPDPHPHLSPSRRRSLVNPWDPRIYGSPDPSTTRFRAVYRGGYPVSTPPSEGWASA